MYKTSAKGYSNNQSPKSDFKGSPKKQIGIELLSKFNPFNKRPRGSVDVQTISPNKVIKVINNRAT